MTVHIQHFDAPDGTRMVVLPAVDFDRLTALAEETTDVAAGERELARIDAGGGTMPAPVLDAILDEGLTPVAAWRRFRGFSQSLLAAKAGLSQVFVSRIERGESHGTPATRGALAHALDVPLWTLETDVEARQRLHVRPEFTVANRIMAVLADGKELTAKQIAEAVFGPGARQQRVNSECNLLVERKKIICSGRGGNGAPFRYGLPK